MRELVAEHEPLFFDEYLKAMNGPVVRIEQESGERARLSRPIPAVAAVNNYGDVLKTNGVHDE